MQMLVKMVNMFSADHKSAAGLLQRSYDLLNPLVKQSRHLTLGFVDQRILLNNILTAEDSLKPLENEFLKRGIGAVTFEAGITVRLTETQSPQFPQMLNQLMSKADCSRFWSRGSLSL